MHTTVGVCPFPAGVTAYSASMNSYMSLTDAPSRSTRLLFSGKYSPFRVRGYAARVPGDGPARIAAVAALRRRAFLCRLLATSRANARVFQDHGQHPRSAVMA